MKASRGSQGKDLESLGCSAGTGQASLTLPIGAQPLRAGIVPPSAVFLIKGRAQGVALLPRQQAAVSSVPETAEAFPSEIQACRVTEPRALSPTPPALGDGHIHCELSWAFCNKKQRRQRQKGKGRSRCRFQEGRALKYMCKFQPEISVPGKLPGALNNPLALTLA